MPRLLQNMYGNKMDIKKHDFCLEETNLVDLQIAKQYNATIVMMVWYFNTDKQLDNTTESRNHFIYLESIVEIKLPM